MREIKFRGWSKREKYMYKWKLIHNGSLDDMIADKDIILMQYTGLRDKDGKEIYESDIIRGSGMEFSTTSSRVYFGCDGAQVEIGDHWVQLSDFEEREVIGNIYEKSDK